MNRYYVRKFLNRRGHFGGAYVLAYVERAPANATTDYCVDSHLEIADCNRRVALDFPVWSKRDRANSVAKARLLAEVTARFAEALAAEVEEMANRPEPDDECDEDDDGFEDVRVMFEGDSR